jgi:hypothetical protein
MVAELGERRIGVSDRALLLMGFAGSFRRSELVSLDVEGITDTEDGLRISVRRSKSDQEVPAPWLVSPTAPTLTRARCGHGARGWRSLESRRVRHFGPLIGATA